MKGLRRKRQGGTPKRISIIVSRNRKAKRYLNDISSARSANTMFTVWKFVAEGSAAFFGSLVRHFIFRHFDGIYRIVLNAELSSIFHFPFLRYRTPNRWLPGPLALPPSNLPTEGVFGRARASIHMTHQYGSDETGRPPPPPICDQ